MIRFITWGCLLPDLHRREGEEGALDLAHSDADHREADSDDIRLPTQDPL